MTNIDDGVTVRLKAQARDNARSVVGEIRHVFKREASRPRRAAEFFARADELAATRVCTGQTDSAILVREDRFR